MSDNTTQKVKYSLLEPAHFRLDGGAMFGIIPRPLWTKVAPPDEMNRINLALRLWCIETADRFILVDTGVGDYHGEKFDHRFDVRGGQNPLALALEKLGKKPEDVTDLIITHLHFDHVGGIGTLRDGEMKPLFENATCHVHQKHYEYSLSPTERDKGSFHSHFFVPVLDWYKKKGQLKFHEGEDGDILSLTDENTLKFKVSHGHTPFLMHPYDNECIYMADLIPTSHHISLAWVMGYDISPGITTEDKKRFLSFIMKNNLRVIYEHDPEFWGSRIGQDDKGRFICSECFEQEDKLSYSFN